jgi:transcriptional regulator with XRE-family HTH domain
MAGKTTSRREEAQGESHGFGAWLRQRRKALDLTQSELGQKAGYTQRTIAKIEKNEQWPSKGRGVARLAAALSIPPKYYAAFAAFARRGTTEAPFPPAEHLPLPYPSDMLEGSKLPRVGHTRPPVDTFRRKEEPESFLQFLENRAVREVWVAGQTLCGLFGNYEPEILRAAENGKRMRFIVMDSNCPSALVSAGNSRQDTILEQDGGVKKLGGMIEDTIQKIKKIERMTSVEVADYRVVNFVLNNLYFIAKEEDNSFDRMIVEMYQYMKAPIHRYLLFLTRLRDKELFEYHHGIFEAMWNSGSR